MVWGERVFATGADETGREVYALDARDGRLLWRHEVAGIEGPPAAPPAVTPDTGHAASPAATDGRRVFALFSTGELVAVDFDGRRLWGVALEVPDNPYGHASSPLVWRDRLIVQYDDRFQARRAGAGRGHRRRRLGALPRVRGHVVVAAAGRARRARGAGG